MKRVKNYIDVELAKRKLTRYKFWSIKDESGILICSSEENNPDNAGFSEVLDKILKDNVDAEVQVKYGTNEASARNNPPLFVRINQEIEWVEADDDNTVQINGVPHRVDKNGNVNINLTTPENPRIETAEPINSWRDEMEMRLNGIRQEYEIKEEKLQADLQNKLVEQSLKFKEMLLAERENRIREKEMELAGLEADLAVKKAEIQENLSGYLKEVPSALGGLIKSFIKDKKEKKEDGDTVGAVPEQEPVERTEVEFSIVEDDTEEKEDLLTELNEEDEELQDTAEPISGESTRATREIASLPRSEPTHETQGPNASGDGDSRASGNSGIYKGSDAERAREFESD